MDALPSLQLFERAPAASPASLSRTKRIVTRTRRRPTPSASPIRPPSTADLSPLEELLAQLHAEQTAYEHEERSYRALEAQVKEEEQRAVLEVDGKKKRSWRKRASSVLKRCKNSLHRWRPTPPLSSTSPSLSIPSCWSSSPPSSPAATRHLSLTPPLVRTSTSTWRSGFSRPSFISRPTVSSAMSYSTLFANSTLSFHCRGEQDDVNEDDGEVDFTWPWETSTPATTPPSSPFSGKDLDLAA
ncbi:hypothetical protein JCM8547_001080 [Rhodosporidiobolus lusitaniae]